MPAANDPVPTPEQAAIIEAARALDRGRAMKAVAYAGAAKTSTCVMVARALPERRFFYGAFNARIAKEADGRFPRNVASSTIHAMARRSVDVPLDRISKRGLNGLVVRDIADALRLERMNGKARTLVTRTLLAFLASADALPGARHAGIAATGMQGLPATAADMREMERKAVAAACAVWAHYGAWRQNGVEVPHDVYLKLFERDEGLVRSAFSQFHTAFLDEAQDANPVIRSVFERSGCAVIAVGDPMQAIYGFRGAEDALDLLPGERFHLSRSFRFGETIAAAAWAILASRPEGAPSVRLRGSGAGGKVVVDRPCRVTLFRTNAGLVRKALSHAAAGRSIHVIGGVDELIKEIRSALALHQGRPNDITADALRGFFAWSDFVSYVEDTMDVGLDCLVKMVSSGEAANVGLLEGRCINDEARADVVLSTAHKAKGLEYDEVALADDFLEKDVLLRRWSKANLPTAPRDGRLARAVLEEWNVLYVAATRGKSLVSFPSSLSDFLADMKVLPPLPPAAPASGGPAGTASARDVPPAGGAEPPPSAPPVPAVHPVPSKPYRRPMPRIGFVRGDARDPAVAAMQRDLGLLSTRVVFSAAALVVSDAAVDALRDHVLLVPSLIPHLGADPAAVRRTALALRAAGIGLASVAEGFEVHADEIPGLPMFPPAEPARPAAVAARRPAVSAEGPRHPFTAPAAALGG